MEQYVHDFGIIWQVMCKTYIAHILFVWVMVVFTVEKWQEYQEARVMVLRKLHK